ncbi:MAG: potassium channel family protein [Actinomycetota bacterium]
MDDQRKNVKDLLAGAKDASELMVDLAYAAVFFNEESLAQEVDRLEERMGDDLHDLRTLAMLAARNAEDAEQMAGVLWIADAIEKIGDAASDIARVVAARLGIPDALRRDLRHADEMTARVRIEEDAPAIGRSLRDLSLATETGMWAVAIRSGMDWRFDPGADDVLSEDDVLLVRGPAEGVPLVRELAGGPATPEPDDGDAPALSELDRAVDILVELKDLAEAAVGLAYSSLLFNNRSLAAEVGALEERSDTLHDELESWVLRASPEARNPDELRGLLRLASASEVMCDAAREMTWYVESGEPLHPVVQLALEETEETSAQASVEAGSAADGRSIRDLKVETETGMFVLAVQRGARWNYRPRSAFVLREGDRVIAVGPEDGADALESLCNASGEPTPED